MSGTTYPNNEADSLPIPANARVFSTGSYVLMWWSSLIVTATEAYPTHDW